MCFKSVKILCKGLLTTHTNFYYLSISPLMTGCLYPRLSHCVYPSNPSYSVISFFFESRDPTGVVGTVYACYGCGSETDNDVY